MGELTSVNESGQTRSFSYDELGRMTSETNPESGTTAFTYGSASACGSASYPGSLAATPATPGAG